MNRIWGRRTPRLKNRTPCGYCFSNWASGYDHLVPVSHDGFSIPRNLYPCCKRCNSLLSNKMFNSLEEKREHVRQALKEKGCWEVRELRKPDDPDSSLEKVLLVPMPLGFVGQEKPKKHRPKPDRRCPNCYTPFSSIDGQFSPYCSKGCWKLAPIVERYIRDRELREELSEEGDMILILLPFPSFGWCRPTDTPQGNVAPREV